MEICPEVKFYLKISRCLLYNKDESETSIYLKYWLAILFKIKTHNQHIIKRKFRKRYSIFREVIMLWVV